MGTFAKVVLSAFTLGVLSMVYCSWRMEYPSASTKTRAKGNEVSAAPVENDPPAVPGLRMFSIIGFGGDGEIARECVDVGVAPIGGHGEDAVDARISNAIEGTKEKNPDAVIVDGPCAVVVNRPELARCTYKKTRDETVTVTVLRLYDIDMIDGTDVNMKGCLKDGGEWVAVRRDSDEFRRARMEGAMRKLEAEE